MKKVISLLFATTVVMLSSVSHATEQATVVATQHKAVNAKTAALFNKDKIQIQLILDKINKKLPGTPITSIQKAPKMEGLYEVVMGRNVAYVDSKVETFLFGHIFDLATQQDLTQARLEAMNKVDFSKLPLDKAIKIVKGDGSRVFAVFTDPDCPYCKQLEKNLENSDNYTMYVLLYPIAQLHPEASDHANAIWCAVDQAQAWHNYMVDGVLPDEKLVKKDCATPIAELAELGQSMGVNGTPTLVRKDGKLLPGAPQGPMLESFLSGKEQAQPQIVTQQVPNTPPPAPQK